MNSQTYFEYKLYIVILLFSFLSMFFQLIPLNTSVYLRVPITRDEMDMVNLTLMSIIIYAIMQIPGKVLPDKNGRIIKYILPLSILIITLGCLLYGYSRASYTLGQRSVLIDAGRPVAYVWGMFVAIKFLPPKWLPLFIGIAESNTTSGSIILLAPLRVMLNNLGWYTTAGIVIGCCLLLFILYWILVKKLEHSQRSKITIGMVFKISFRL